MLKIISPFKSSPFGLMCNVSLSPQFVSKTQPENVKEVWSFLYVWIRTCLGLHWTHCWFWWQVVVWKRYSELKKLHGELAYTHRNLFRRLEEFPPFPRAQVFGKVNENAETWCKHLWQFCHFISHHLYLKNLIFMTLCCKSASLYSSNSPTALSVLSFVVLCPCLSLSQVVLMRLWLKRGGKQPRPCCCSLQTFLLCTTALSSKISSG